ncbi:MBL fold metallo-hydrolase [Hydrogenovibrio sp. 3SP14C1]|uniref:MBL fold metallo-hydrolase n=1 Tax=Hydrogenovibrio sp. 3SP14C1 TaxID=3038774 RepID=UPI002416A675|nr:MBL fold metallo-hydrolase [Hydrogenovibrio sp. 3SP14C1]MDG4812632.1 MBL fold metallo-hydrolase [Hydrogenovibrio sp. 3SP14C1]
MNKIIRWFGVLFAFGMMSSAWSAEVEFRQVTPGVYAFVGPLTDRTPENLGLNNNIGLIDTSEGWVFVDSGAGDLAAKALEKAAQKIKAQPVVAVVNLGSQDHRWLGNDYFARQGAKIYAYQGTVNTQKKMFAQLQDSVVKKVPALKGMKMKTADKVFESTQNQFSIGGVSMQLNFYGDAHFSGDAVLWLPEQKVLFTGDVVYVDRMLGIHPWSNVVSWNKAYQAMRALPAEFVVPGHGRVTNWQKADAETGDYLAKLVQTMTEEAENFSGVGVAVSNNKNWPAFKHLKHYDSWHKRNLNRAYLQIEASL